MPLKETSFLWSVSELRRFIPGSVWSFATRLFLFSEKKIKKKATLFLIIQEAQAVVLGSALFSLFSFSFVFYNLFPNSVVLPLLIFAYACLFIACLVYVYRNPLVHLRFLALSVGAFLFFSLGAYFAIISITPLSPYYLLTFLSLFSLSYLVGYLSLITPMGLGVREGVLTFGLSQFIASPAAALYALYARAVIVVSELIFFSLMYFWYRAKDSMVIRAEHFIKNHLHELILTISITIYIMYFSFASFARHDNFYSGKFDLGNMVQTVWNTSQGRIFQLTDPNGTEIISRLSFHADFFLILLAPFYKVWADPRMLLLIQTVVLACGAIFIYLIAQKILQQKFLALVFAGAYLLNPSVQYTNLYDFHAVTLATTFLLGVFYFLLEKKHLFFLFFAILAGLTKENVWIIVSFFGAYIFLREKALEKKTFGFFLFFICIFISYYLISIAIPQSRGGDHFALSYYSDFGDTPTTIFKNVLISPEKVIGALLQSDRFTYIYQLFSPLGFVSFLSPLFLAFALPDFFISVLSNNSSLRQIYFHYAAAITPFLFISAIYGAKKIVVYMPKYSYLIIYYLLFVACYSAYAFSPLPGAKNPSITMFTNPYKNKEIIQMYLKQIDKEKSVVATNNLGAHLTHRQKLYTIPTGIYEADVIVFLLNDISAQPSLASQISMTEELKKNNLYEVDFEKEDFVAFRKK